MSAEFAYLSHFLKQRSGLDLSADKQYLLDSRLRPVARKHGLDGIAALVAALKHPDKAALGDEVVEAMTTNESFFFRDKTPFDQFREIIVPELLPQRSSMRKLRIWCAAASTGQEPYSLGMELREMQAKLANWSIDIIGTDLSPQVLEKARAGIYSQFEVQRGLPVQLLVKYFEQKGEMWQLAPQIRAMVDYRIQNLLDDFSRLGKFDIVFCRNVLIYFDAPTKSDVLARIRKQLAPDGYLVLGASETIIGLSDDFELVDGSRGLYRPKSAANSQAPPMVAAGGGASMPAMAAPAPGPSAAAGAGPRPAGLVQAGQPMTARAPLGTAPSTGVPSLRAPSSTTPAATNGAGHGSSMGGASLGAGTPPRPVVPSADRNKAAAPIPFRPGNPVGFETADGHSTQAGGPITVSPANMRTAPPPPSPSRGTGLTPPAKPAAGSAVTPPRPVFKPKD